MRISSLDFHTRLQVRLVLAVQRCSWAQTSLGPIPLSISSGREGLP